MNLRFHNTHARHRTIPSLKKYFTGISTRVCWVVKEQRTLTAGKYIRASA